MRMRRVTWPGDWDLGVIQNHIFGISDPYLPIHFYGATTTIKGSLYVARYVRRAQIVDANYEEIVRNIILLQQ